MLGYHYQLDQPDCAWNDDQLGVQSTCFIVSERKFQVFQGSDSQNDFMAC